MSVTNGWRAATQPLLWSASCAWTALMLIVWDLFVPKGLPVDTFTLLTLSGPLFLAAASVVSGVPARAVSATGTARVEGPAFCM